MIIRGLPVLLVLAGCSSPPPPVDIEIVKIHAWVEQYAVSGAALSRDLERGGENSQASRDLEQALADLRRIYPYPDGAKYIDAELASARAYWQVRVDGLRRREEELFARRQSLTPVQREALESVIRERDDAERRLAALAGLEPALRRS